MTTTRPPRRQPPSGRQGGRRHPPEPVGPPPRTVVVAVRKLFDAETPEYFLLLGTTLFLVVFGLVMVLSSSSIESRVEGGDFFAQAARQGLYALVGVPAMLLAARAPMAFWKRWAGIAVVIGVALQLLVFLPGLGYERGQNRNWINLGSFTAQPSELIKLALVIWLAWVLSRKGDALHEWREVALPILPIAIVTTGLVLAGNDLGTATMILAIVFGALFYAGVRLRIIGTALAGIALVALMFIQLSDSRSNRIAAWLNQCQDPALYSNDCWQSIHGWEALAHGGVFGVGLGNSSGKWSWIPEAANDFIFAIIGEELGLLGAILVLALFVVLAVCFVRIIRMSRDPFAKLATSAAMVWVIGQAFVNIAVVLGLLPVLGVPLPLVSAGGSALITTLTVIGVVLSFARHRPEAGGAAVTVYLLAGGGTAGHVNPLLATADRLRERDPESTVFVLGTAEGLESRLVPERGYELLTVPRLPFPRRPDGDLLRFPGRWRATVRAARAHLRERQVDVVVGFGGYASAPAYLAARREKVPIAIHEANARPGLANRLGARFTRFVGVTFASTRLRRSRVVGFPLRHEIERLDRAASRDEGMDAFGLDPRRPVLLVTGGSSGAKRINDTVLASAAVLIGSGWQVLHLSGGLREGVVDPGLPGYHLLPYSDRMDLALAAADLAISRAGSGTVSELAAVGLPAIFVPYAVGNGEQAYNAVDAVRAGGAVLVSDAAFTPDWVRVELLPLLADRARVADLAARIGTVGHRDGADRMVDLVFAARDSRRR